jgi:Domain of Unknown Function (DUF1206)
MTVRSARRTARSAGQEAASSHWLQWLARGGLVARGVNYMLVGLLAVQIALGAKGKQADSAGALHEVASQHGGIVVLWLLAAGFAGLALWRLAEAAYGQPGRKGHTPVKRLQSLGLGVFYGFTCAGIIAFISGTGGPSAGNTQAADLTARIMTHTGGRLLVIGIGVCLLAAGVALAVYGFRKKFARNLVLAQASARTREAVLFLGMAGNVARGVVFGVAGGLLVAAAVSFDPKKAQGLDGSLRKIATTPLGPWLLVAVALGLAVFGIYSWCEARWRIVRPG